MGELQEGLISYIYGLYSSSNPEEIRYIGYSYNPIKRLSDHLSESKQLKYHRHKWIQSEIAKGYSIGISSLRCVSESCVGQAEVETILLYKSFGAKLTNGNNGGMGGRSPSKESRERMRVSKLGNTWNIGREKSEKTKLLISIGNKGRNLDKAREKALETIRGKRSSKRNIDDSTVIELYSLYNSGFSLGEIIEKTGVKKYTISNIFYSATSYRDVKEKYNLKLERTSYVRDGFNKYKKRNKTN